MNPLLQDIAIKSSSDLCDLIRDGEQDILSAINKLVAESQANDTKPKFKLGFSITVDFDKHQYDCDLSWSLKQTLGTSHKIDDANQPSLPMGGVDSVTFSSGATSITIGSKEAEMLRRAADEMSK